VIAQINMNITPLCLHGEYHIGRFFARRWKKLVSPSKTALAKIVFAGKNRFLPEYIVIEIKFVNFCLYLIERTYFVESFFFLTVYSLVVIFTSSVVGH